MEIGRYISELQKLFASGQATEHSFRPPLLRLFQSIDPDLFVLNEPRRLTDVGAPDFVFNRNGIAVGWCEAKDIGKNIKEFGKSDYSREQKQRYIKGLSNLIYTNGLDFEFIRDGKAVAYLSIADLTSVITPRPDRFPTLETYLKDFAQANPISITTSKRLASLMAGKAAIIREIIRLALSADLETQDNEGTATDLIGQFLAFKVNLIRDITPDDFADIYAETIAYGLFAARLHDTGGPATYSRAEALDLLPKSNPFLYQFFRYIAGPDIDDRLRGVIDQLCDVFCAADLSRILADFGRLTARQDPFLHFYEDFLAQYNPTKRKARGVWYTPEPIVRFIVRAVDQMLKSEFNVSDGIADTSSIVIDWDSGHNDRRGQPVTIKKHVHRVQILDPATGTGTFLAEVVRQVAEKVQGVAPGQWSTYVEDELIPRIHGFELLMASYAMCHMKLDIILTELGYKPSRNPPRLNVYLTNSLEAGERVEQTLFGLSKAIAEEAKAASDIKRQLPIMCVIGNPPYSGISKNKDPWISGLIEDYKYVDGVHFGERKHWLQDDYVKFIRLASKMIEKNGLGIVGYVTNHGYLSNPTFRGMRNHLLRTFDKIYVIDLHGNTNKRERSPDNEPDKNVFDIRQGVAIIIAVKRQASSPAMACVYRCDLWGGRQKKNETLLFSNLELATEEVDCFAPYYMFYNISREKLKLYDEGFPLAKLFQIKSVGAVSGRDAINVSFTREEAASKMSKLVSLSDTDARQYFGLKEEDARDWTLNTAREDARSATDANYAIIYYRPFDPRWTCFTGVSRGLYASPQSAVLGNLVNRPNIALVFNKSLEGERPFADVFVFRGIIQHHSLSIKEVNYVAPLYLFPREGELQQDIRINYESRLFNRLLKAAGIKRDPSPITDVSARLAAKGDLRPNEIKVFDYVYGVLHWPSYRSDYAEFLSIDFPHVPLPGSSDIFRAVSALGEKLRRLHLFDAEVLGHCPFLFEGDGNSSVERIQFREGSIYINQSQYFANVPREAWELFIGSYRPAEKWLKDRLGRRLDWNEIRHFQNIIGALSKTHLIMLEIDDVLDSTPQLDSSPT